VNLKNLKEEQRVVSGIHDIYGSLFDELGYKNVIKNPERNDASVDMLEEDFGISMDLNRVYQMMDRLDTTAIDKLKRSGV
ncbi:MAG: hypothetical protein KKG95_02470, partial [Candidatus Omnitrophica bacterium]|nr:hypothetical protein [Candidatus Omnitrophota bacterium]